MSTSCAPPTPDARGSAAEDCLIRSCVSPRLVQEQRRPCSPVCWREESDALETWGHRGTSIGSNLMRRHWSLCVEEYPSTESSWNTRGTSRITPLACRRSSDPQTVHSSGSAANHITSQRRP